MFNLFSDEISSDSPAYQSVMSRHFVDLFAGYHEVGGDSTPFTKAVGWFEAVPEASRARVIHACVIVYQKPTKLLFLGRTNSQIAADAEVGLVLDPKLAAYLPHISSVQIRSLTGSARQQFVDSRKEWAKEFRSVNLSMCRRIALMSVEHMDKKIPSVRQLKKSMSNKRPSLLTDTDINQIPNAQSRAIFLEQIKEFKDHKAEWNNNSVHRLFQISVAEVRPPSIYVIPSDLDEALNQLFQEIETGDA